MGFFGGGASVDLASPSAIGSTTPNTGAFTTLSANNGTITTSSPAFTLAQTWNAAGQTFTALRVNATDTASASGSLLIDLQIGGSSRFSVSKSGLVTTSDQFARSNSAFGIASNGADFEFSSFGSTRVFIRNTGTFESRQSGGGIAWNFGSGTRLALMHEADYVLAQRVTTNAQTFRIYNTFTDASNYERGFLRWASNVFEIGAEAAGTGTQRQLRFPLGTVTASTPLSITQTWNASGVICNALLVNVTDTASSASSTLMDLQVGGSSQYQIRKNGTTILPDLRIGGNDVSIYGSFSNASSGTVSDRRGIFGAGINGIRVSSTWTYGWSSNAAGSGDAAGSTDTALRRNEAGVVEVNNGTAGTFRDLIVRNFRMSAPTGVPTANNSTGTEGSIRWDADYIYICTATNTWKRVAIATWP